MAQNYNKKLGLNKSKSLNRRIFLLCLGSLPVFGQANQGELQLHITDPAGAGLAATVLIISQANLYSRSLATDARGTIDAQHLPYGLYRVEIERNGFAVFRDCLRPQFLLRQLDRLFAVSFRGVLC